MSSDGPVEFTKESIDSCLMAVAKEYKRQVGPKVPAELILIGGASVLINYGFRNMTTDMDAMVLAASVMQDVINNVGDDRGLPRGWLNQDFKKTASYSNQLIKVSKNYKTFAGVLTVRTVSAEYLIAMKLKSGRRYKSDLSDVIGILAAHETYSEPIKLEQIQKAVNELYGSWDALPETSRYFIENIMNNRRFSELYKQVSGDEKTTRDILVRFEKDHPGEIRRGEADKMIEELVEKEDSSSIIAELQRRKV